MKAWYVSLGLGYEKDEGSFTHKVHRLCVSRLRTQKSLRKSAWQHQNLHRGALETDCTLAPSLASSMPLGK